MTPCRNSGKGGVLIFRRVCALVQGQRGGHSWRVSVDPELCRDEDCGCHRYCSRVFRCPGLVFDEAQGRAALDEVVCWICPAGAIKAKAKENAA